MIIIIANSILSYCWHVYYRWACSDELTQNPQMKGILKFVFSMDVHVHVYCLVSYKTSVLLASSNYLLIIIMISVLLSQISNVSTFIYTT